MIFKLSRAWSLSFPTNEVGIIFQNFSELIRDIRAQSKTMQRGRPNVAAVTVGQPAVLAGIIATPVTERIISSLFLHKDPHYNMAPN